MQSIILKCSPKGEGVNPIPLNYIKDSFVLIVYENGQAVGATTTTPLAEEMEDIRVSYENPGINGLKLFILVKQC